MKNTEIYNRMNNPQVFRGYVNMIKNLDVDIVEQLRENIKEQASDHPKYEMLEKLFVERLGE